MAIAQEVGHVYSTSIQKRQRATPLLRHTKQRPDLAASTKAIPKDLCRRASARWRATARRRQSGRSGRLSTPNRTPFAFSWSPLEKPNAANSSHWFGENPLRTAQNSASTCSTGSLQAALGMALEQQPGSHGCSRVALDDSPIDRAMARPSTTQFQRTPLQLPRGEPPKAISFSRRCLHTAHRSRTTSRNTFSGSGLVPESEPL